MALISQESIAPPAERPGPGLQRLLDEEAVPVPAALRADSFVDLGSTADIPVSRYTSREFHDLEVEKVWKRVWQMACREDDIPDIGDTYVYEVATISILVVRVAPDLIKAFPNACLHRGSQLRTCPGNVPELRCPFHGFAWNLDGTLKDVPHRWDFKHLVDEEFCLPEVQVGTWEGFVFVNMDPAAPPLEKYLGGIVEHFQSLGRPPLKDRWKAIHVAKVVRCNWKVGLEAFIESFHSVATHPQALLYSGTASVEYDIYPDEPHWNRMVFNIGVPGVDLDEVDQQEIADNYVQDILEYFSSNVSIPVPDGGTARQAIAEYQRARLGEMGFDASELTMSELLDGIEYFLFPNLVPFGSVGAPIVYRFRPYGNDPDASIMEIMILLPVAPGVKLPAIPVQWIGEDESWASAPMLGGPGAVNDQDTANMARVQKGLHTMTKPGVTLSGYQESRIRHFHQTLEHYISQ